jgi:hypothetical protein
MTALASTASDDHQLFTTTVNGATDLTALVPVSGAIGDYDWSGMSLQFQRSPDSAANLPCATLISDTHAICARHAGYTGTPIAAGDTYYFRTPAGTIATGVVAAKTTIDGDVALIRFDSNPSADLARYPIMLDQEVMVSQTFWAPEHDSTALLRECTSVTDSFIIHDDGGWGGTPASSGRPCVAPLDDGRLAILGTHYTALSFPRLDYHLSAIQAELGGYSETAETVEIDTTPPDLATSLAGRWKLNGVVTDSSGNGRNGTLNGTASFTTGGRTGGQCLSTVNTSSFLSVGTFDLGTSFGVGGWVKWNGTDSAVQTVFAKGDTFVDNDFRWQMYVIHGSNVIGANSPQAGGTNATFALSDSADLMFQANKWEHLFFTYTGGNLSCYRNGVLMATRAYTFDGDTTATVKIGANGANAFQWEGFFEDVWMFADRAPTAEEVVAIMNAGDIVIESPMYNQIIQRDTTTLLGDIPISGHYDSTLGTPTGIEGKFNGGAWTALTDCIIADGVFSGTLAGQATGTGNLEVRWANATSRTFVQYEVGVGRIFVVAGQSNAAGLGTNNQTYSGTAKCKMFTESHNTWKVLADPTNTDIAHGSIWPLLANALSTADDTCPIGFITTADGGTGLISDGATEDSYAWDRELNGASYLNMLDRVVLSGANAIEEVLWHQGEAEAYAANTTAEYYAAMVAFMENIRDDLPGSPLVRIAQLGQIPNTEPAADSHAIRQAQVLLFSHELARPGPVSHDINLADGGGDSLHFKTNAELQTMAERWASCLAGDIPPRIVGAYATVGTTSLILQYDQTLTTATPEAAAFTVTGSVNGPIVVSAAAASGSRVTLTLADAVIAGETLTVIYGSGNSGQGVTNPTVGTLPAYAQTFVGGAGVSSGDSAGFTAHTSVKFSPANFPYSYLG